MTLLSQRLGKLDALLPRPLPRPAYDLSRITPEQRTALDRLNDRFLTVGLEGLIEDELDEIIDLVTILGPGTTP